MVDFKAIAEGFINNTKQQFGVANKKIEDKATKRYEICLSCDTISEGKGKCDKSKGGCNCLLAWLVRQDTKKCIKNKW